MSSGLVVSRLGVQATANDDVVHGLICLRVSIPKENDANHALRWNLFTNKPPKLVSPPSILPLPLPIALRSSSTPRTSRPRALAIASTLLGLPTPSSYPPSRQVHAPHLDISSSSGQVSVVLEPTGKGKAKHASGPGGGKTEWVVIMEFEKPIEQGSERGFSKVLLSLPKCLHSVIRFQISAPAAGPSTGGEVSIMTEPKMLALPPSTFSSPALPYPRKTDGQIGYEDGWEDGEDLRDGQMSEGESEDEDSGSWLEGRFQATPQLRLEWSFASSSNVNTLQITPRWDAHHPSIQLLYENAPSEASSDPLVPVEMVIPDGWGWKDLDVSGPNLVSWRSTDTDHFNVHLREYDPDEEEEEGPDDSFSTIRNLRPQARAALGPRTHTSASLMKQTLPVAGDLRVDDFSFEMTSGDNLTIPASTGSGGSRPGTPGRFSPSPTSPGSVCSPVGLNQPVEARCFDLIFDGEGDGRSFVMEGTLVPLSPLTLVSGSTPMLMPFIRTSSRTECVIQCPNSVLSNDQKDEGTCETSGETIGTFIWTDASGLPVEPPTVEPVKGHIRVRLFRDQWGARSMSVVFPWPGRSPEVIFTLAGDRSVRIAKADIEGIAIPRSVTRGKDGGQEVRLGRGPVVRSNGRVTEVSLDFSGSDGFIPFPKFQDAQGDLTFELRGEGWDDMVKLIRAPFVRSKSSPNTFHAKLPVSTPLIPTTTKLNPSASPNRARTLFSLNTFFYLFILWLIISLGQQVQRLRTELSFVAEEARDLRMYGFDQRQPPPEAVITEPRREVEEVATIFPDGTDVSTIPVSSKVKQRKEVAVEGERSLGRVVFGHSSWDIWTNNPTVRTLGKGITRIWEAFVWLIGGS